MTSAAPGLRSPGILLALPIVLGLATWSAPAGAQEPDSVRAAPVPVPLRQEADSSDSGGPVSPGGAFARSVVLPGWGHAAIGSHTRGAFYFAAETTTLWMLARTIRRRAAARDARDFRERVAEARLRAQGVEDPQTIEETLAEDPDVSAARSLVSAREQQFEDWLALGIFLAFLGGADAFVSAHLRDFPEPVRVDLRPVGDRWEIGLSVRIPPTR
ncbi:MAG: hypothetical protein PVI57_16740 [Gemmatimonadota bacterium]